MRSSRGNEDVLAGVVPHAGWIYCGSIMADVLLRLPDDVETVIVLGGHNPPGGAFISYHYDQWNTPTGSHPVDSEFVRRVEESFEEKFVDERLADNTVEVVMVMALALKPGLRWSAWRVPSDNRALSFGKTLAGIASESDRRIAVVGSTDLTHYGKSYGLITDETLNTPIQWVKDRDSSILEALVNFEGKKALTLAVEDQCACSGGGAVAAMSYAYNCGARRGRVLSYGTSFDVSPGDSFVGYAGVVWE